MTDVGDGRTSANREGGSFRSLFQMPVPHVKELGPGCPRPSTVEDPECAPQALTPASTDGVLGWEAVGDIELLANDPFLGCGGGCCCDVSFNHDARRTGLGGWTEVGIFSWR